MGCQVVCRGSGKNRQARAVYKSAFFWLDQLKGQQVISWQSAHWSDDWTPRHLNDSLTLWPTWMTPVLNLCKVMFDVEGFTVWLTLFGKSLTLLPTLSVYLFIYPATVHSFFTLEILVHNHSLHQWFLTFLGYWTPCIFFKSWEPLTPYREQLFFIVIFFFFSE